MNRPILLPLLWACATISPLIAAEQPTSRPLAAKICLNCHQAAPGNIRGNFDNFAGKVQSFQVKLDDTMDVFRYDKATLKVKTHEAGATVEDSLKAIKKGHEVRVEYTERDGVKTAQVVSVKPPVSLAMSETISLTEVEKLVVLGPEKGKYFLVDCRPAPRFQEGNIPTAINLPFPSFDKTVDKLPKDKGALIIYYCSGKTCNMSPGSFRKAQALGYSNVKVFVDGMPGWFGRNFGSITPKSFKEAFLDKDIPAIVLDLRAQTEQGAIQGAVAADPMKVAELLKTLPAPKLKPPVLVVSADGGEPARKVARELVMAGYNGVNVLEGGLGAWQSAGYPLVHGKLAVRATYVPKPRPGSISSEAFSKIASLAPEQRKGVLILDVRNPDETGNGIIKGALVIPEPMLASRIGELPKEKGLLVVTHCATGVRAELAYHLLREQGYNAKFLNAEITIIDTGEFTID